MQGGAQGYGITLSLLSKGGGGALPLDACLACHCPPPSQIARPPPRVSPTVGLGSGLRKAFLLSFQAMQLLLVQSPYFKNQRWGARTDQTLEVLRHPVMDLDFYMKSPDF